MGHQERIKIPEKEWILREMLKVALEDEKNAQIYGRQLARAARVRRDRSLLYRIADDEERHYRLLRSLYREIFRHSPSGVRVFPRKPERFDVAVRKAIADEYEGISFYREILGRLEREEHKNIVRSIMAEEQRHAHWLEGLLD